MIPSLMQLPLDAKPLIVKHMGKSVMAGGEKVERAKRIHVFEEYRDRFPDIVPRIGERYTARLYKGHPYYEKIIQALLKKGRLLGTRWTPEQERIDAMAAEGDTCAVCKWRVCGAALATNL